MQPRWVSSPTECVDDEALFSLARGALDPEELAQVEAHLRDCAECRAVLGEAARSLTNAALEPSMGPSGPSTIARYQVRALIGAGASGVVYRAFDPNLKRTVAIKVLRPDLHGTSPELSARMLREAQAMARLSDPHVVSVYDVGMQDGAVYLVMEHVNGATLSEWLHASPRSTEHILKVFGDAARGLVAAHEKGLVHLDFKPENVLVESDGRALVTDFGLAREAEVPFAQSGLDAMDTAELYAPTRGLVGTPAYMAPELFDGGRATASSDQFAFCVSLFAALFKRHPFQAGEGITLEELIDKVREGALEPPTSLGLSDRRAERLFFILKRGLSPDPSARFPNLRALVSALEGASRRPLSRPLLGLAVAASLLFAIWLWAASPWNRSANEPSPEASMRITARHMATAKPTSPPDAQAPNPSAATSTAPANPARATDRELPTRSSQTRATKRKPQRKKVDVRYRDWLKDPF